MAACFILANGAPLCAQDTTTDNPTGPDGEYNGDVTTAGRYDSYTGDAKRAVTDLVVPGSNGTYPLAFTRTFNSLPDPTGNEYACFGDGTNWRHSYQWSIAASEYNQDNNPIAFDVTYPDGSEVTYRPPSARAAFASNEVANFWRGPAGTSDRLEVQSASVFYLHTSDGGKVGFDGAYHPTFIVDPYGATTTLRYTNGYLTRITEPGGRWLRLVYKHLTHRLPGTRTRLSWHVLSQVQASIGQTATYSYDFLDTEVYQDDRVSSYAVLTKVSYDSEASTTGGSVCAAYAYAGDSNGGPPSLVSAKDPHYAGAMSQIQYSFGSTAPAPTLKEENFSTGELVSGLNLNLTNSISVNTETRGDQVAFNAPITRTFSFGQPTTGPFPASSPTNAEACQLTSVTDFEGNTSYQSYFGNGDPNGQGYLAATVDRCGNKVSYEREPILGRVTKVTFADGLTRVSRWASLDDTPGTPNSLANPYYLHESIDERGNSTLYNHYGNGLVQKITYPAGGGFETFSYQEFRPNQANPYCKLSQHVTRLGATIIYHYDEANHGGSGYRGLLTSVQRIYLDGHNSGAQTETTELYYDSWDRLSKSVDPRGVTDSYVYNGRHQLLSVTHAADNTSVSSVYDDFGRCISVTDELGHTSSKVYDEYGRPTSITQPVNWGGIANRTTNFVYDERISNGWVTADALSHTSSNYSYRVLPSGRGVLNIYSPNGWLTDEFAGQAVQNGSGNEIGYYLVGYGQQVQHMDYDAMGRPLDATDENGRMWSKGYDSYGRTVSTTDPMGHQTTTAYWPANDPSTFGGLVKKVTTSGNSPTDDTAQLTTNYTSYDAMGRLTGWTDPKNIPYGSGYDAGGDPIYQTDGLTSSTTAIGYGYDQLGRKTAITYSGTSSEQWSYDASGNVSLYKNRAGNTQTYNPYDSRNRPTGWTWNDGITPGESLTFDAAGRCTNLSNGSCVLVMAYDDSNALKTEQQCIGGNTANATVTYTPDPDGNVQTVTYPHGDAATMSLDNRSRPQTLDFAFAGSLNTPSQVESYGYSGADLQQQTTATNLRTVYGYRGDLLPNSVCVYNGNQSSAVVSASNYGYYANGQLGWFARPGGNGTGNAFDNGSGDSYFYDQKGRLTSVNYDAMNVQGSGGGSNVDSPPSQSPTYVARADTYDYDNAGNRTTDVEGGVSHPASFPTLNQQSGLSYDANGNTTSAPCGAAAYTYSYNAYNQLVSATGAGNSAAFLYDPEGRLCQRTINGVTTRMYYAGSQVVEEDDASNNKLADYLYGIGGERECRINSSSTYFYHYDGRGFLNFVTDANANRVEQYFYDAYGKPNVYDATGTVSRGQTSTVAGGNRFLWAPGYEWYPEIGLYRCGARFYSPTLGRFMQPDPMGQGGGLNIYGYCNNDPINGSDPSGLEPETSVPTVQPSGDTIGDANACSEGGDSMSNQIYGTPGAPVNADIPDSIPFPQSSGSADSGGRSTASEPTITTGGGSVVQGSDGSPAGSMPLSNPWGAISSMTNAALLAPITVAKTSNGNGLTYAGLAKAYPLPQDYPTHDLGLPQGTIWSLVGGNIATQGNNGALGNSCATRMSYTLNQNKLYIPFISNTQTLSGAGKTWIIVRVATLDNFIRGNVGNPTSINPTTWQASLAGKTGILEFVFPGGSATGHITLWGGTGTIDGEDFSDRSTQMFFWQIP